MNKTCQACKKNFTIEPDNISFCEKMNTPLPTWCPDCRMMRRLAFVNAWSIYWRDCDKCGKKTMSAYPPENGLIVYCQPCYWADDWDGTEYAMEYDPNKNFLEQVRDLQLKTPQVALETTWLNLKNSDYCNGVAYLKNCYLTFWADYCEETYYSSIVNNLKDCADCLYMFQSELCYDSVCLGDCSRTFFSDTCDNCTDVWFSRNCYGSMYCIGCVNLRGASYCIFNQKYSKEEYFEKLKEFNLDTREGIKKIKIQAEDFIKDKPYREYRGSATNLNVSGEYIFRSKNTKDSYMCTDTEDSKFCQFISVPSAKDCYDYSGWGNNVSQMYECGNVGENASNCKFSYYCYPDSLGLEYCAWCISGKNNFGCASLKRKSYAILNKVYDKETYEKLTAQIREDMVKNPYHDSKGRIYGYGEFFPPEFSLFPYNDSNAIKFIPKTKEQILEAGFTWRDKTENTHQTTINGEDLPETILDSSDGLLKEIIACSNCNKGYKIVEGEYNVLKKIGIPLPSECPKCREQKRFSKINLPRLQDTQCAKCNKEIKTAHDLTSGKIIYCVSCYQKELS